MPPTDSDFTNISRIDGATRSLIAEGVYGAELPKRLRHTAARELNVKNVLEVLPDPDRRITLSDQKDAMGIPKAVTHYSIDDYTRKGHLRSQQDFRRIAELMGGTNLRYSKEGDFANNQHICGTVSGWAATRALRYAMHGDARTTTRTCSLPSTGVIPTCGTCNSTENRGGGGVAQHSAHPRRARRRRAQADADRYALTPCARTRWVALSRCLRAPPSSHRPGSTQKQQTPATRTTRIRRGEYLAVAGDCRGCHTKPGGKPFAGGVVVPHAPR